jgi:protein-tyrosine kinase
VTRIEEALRKARSRVADAARPAAPEAALPRARTPIPAARKKVVFEGAKHHISQEALIRAGLLAAPEEAGLVADEFRRIKRPLITNAALSGHDADGPMNVIMLASALPKAGKTFCSVNLAVSISLERELNVLLVDADVGKPQISREFGLAHAPGLIDLLLDESRSVEDTLVRTDLNDIQVLPAGQSHPQATELLASDRMSRIVQELATRYPDRIIILDSPPLLLTSEAHALASQVGQIAVVVEAGQTSHQMLEQTLEALRTEKAINIILNKASRGNHSGYYGSEYGYYGSGNGTPGNDAR